MSRIIVLLLAAASLALGGCAVVLPDGSVRFAVPRLVLDAGITPTAYAPIPGVVGGYRYIGPSRTLEVQESGFREPVMIKRYDSQGNLIQMYPTCGGGRDPIAGKC